jgi:hypothetical protein
MMEKVILCPERVRKITGSFKFIEHRFLQEGFFYTLSYCELLLYLFLVFVADRHRLSFYSYDKMCTLLRITVDEFILARDGIIEKDLISFDGRTFQVLSLPRDGPQSAPIRGKEQMRDNDPATIHQQIVRSLGGNHDQ